MKDIGEMKEKLFGNGEEGLTVKMKKAEDRLSVLEMHRLELKKTLMWFGGFVIAGVGIIVAILNYFKI